MKTSEPIERKAFRVREVAAALGCSENTIRSRLDDGSIKCVRLGGLLLIPAEELTRLLGTSGQYMERP